MYKFNFLEGKTQQRIKLLKIKTEENESKLILFKNTFIKRIKNDIEYIKIQGVHSLNERFNPLRAVKNNKIIIKISTVKKQIKKIPPKNLT